MNKIPINKNTNYRVLSVAAVAALITFIVYLPTLGNGFVNWDDPVYFYDNPYIRDLNWNFLKWALSATISNNWHPLTMLSHGVDYAIFGPGPFGPHLINNLLHSINTALVALVTFRLVSLAIDEDDDGFALATAFVTALVFGLHPQHVESVAWISERKDLLSALFYLLSLLSFLAFRSATYRRALFYAGALIFMLLGLLSKPMAVTIPLALLIIDFYPLERIGRGGSERIGRVLLEKAPFFALAVIFSIITLLTQKDITKGGPALPDIGNIIATTPTIISAYGFYIYKTVLPLKLSPLYPKPITLVFAFYKLIATAIVALILSIVCIKKYRNPRLTAALWAWFIILLLPVIGIVKIGTQGAADRYTYLPGLAIITVFALWVSSLYAKGAKAGTGPKAGSAMARKLSIAIVACVAITLSGLTIKQIGIWKDPVTFWSSPIESFPSHVPLAFINRAMALEDAGRLDEAIDDYTSAIKLKAGHATSYNNRGNILNALGRYDEAVEDFNYAIRYRPDHSYAYNNRGLSYMGLNRPGRAIGDFKKAISLEPALAEPFINLSDVYQKMGQRKLAIQARKKGLELGYRETRD